MLGQNISLGICPLYTIHITLDYSSIPFASHRVVAVAIFLFPKSLHFDQLANEFVAIKVMSFGYLTSFKALDKGLIENFGPTGFTTFILSLVRFIFYYCLVSFYSTHFLIYVVIFYHNMYILMFFLEHTYLV